MARPAHYAQKHKEMVEMVGQGQPSSRAQHRDYGAHHETVLQGNRGKLGAPLTLDGPGAYAPAYGHTIYISIPEAHVPAHLSQIPYFFTDMQCVY